MQNIFQHLPGRRNRSWQAKSVSLHGHRYWSLLLRGGHQGKGFLGCPRREVAPSGMILLQAVSSLKCVFGEGTLCLKKFRNKLGLPRPNWALSCLDQVTVKQKRKKLKPRSEEKEWQESASEGNWHQQNYRRGLRWTGGANTYLSKIGQELHFHL